ncbi:MAG TPA: ABC transporter ATP-binding protein [Candidatus Limnocylindria bacterium]|nr:ABC transporter ATP-binding protein [Candidatus Limnocylindria bacterium]
MSAPGVPAIELRAVSKRFGAVEAVRDLSFTIAAGEIVGFLGPNGAGKTTTLRMLAGVFPPTTGTVRIAGHDPVHEARRCRRAIGYFPEHAPSYPELTVLEYLHFVARAKQLPRSERPHAVDAVLGACGLGDMARRRVGTLSKGYRQRLGLAQALCGDPPILVLDEPTIGLDPSQVVEIRELVRTLRGNRTVLFSSHILSEVEALCERVVVIAGGRLVGEGTAAELGRRLGARRRVIVRLDASPGELASALAQVDGVLGITSRDDAVCIDAALDVDLARLVGETALARGWRLRELREEPLALEEIFLQLVSGRERPLP